MEEWKKIDGFPHYEVSDQGNIKSLYSGKILKPSVRNDEYLMVNLHKDCKCFPKLVHRLVAQAFVPNPQGKPTVDHINMNKQDNRAVNLRWQTYKEQLNNQDQDYKTNQKSEKVKKIMKKYREANKDKIKQKHKEYCEANKEEIKEYRKEYYEANKEKLKRISKEYYEVNKDKISKRRKEYNEANKENLKEYQKEYYKANKEKIKEKVRLYRLKHKSN